MLVQDSCIVYILWVQILNLEAIIFQKIPVLLHRKIIYIYRYPRSNMSYPTKFEKLTFFDKWINNNVLQLMLKSCESNCLFNIIK